MLTPGHTPGHLCVSVTSGDKRLLLLGDAITCPVQLAEPGWRSLGNVAPARADRTRRGLWSEPGAERTSGVRAHFPQLARGSVIGPGRWHRPD